MNNNRGMRHIFTACAPCCDKCPQIFIDDQASEERRVRVTDDFGQEIRMSVQQLRAIVDNAREGGFDVVLLDEVTPS